MRGLGLGFSFTMLLTLSIWLAFKTRKDSLIFSTSDVLDDCLDTWVYNLVGFSILGLLLVGLKYFEILLTSLLVLARCYELMSLGSDNRTALVLSNTRELNRVPSTE